MKDLSFQSTGLLCILLLISTTVAAQVVSTSRSNDTTATSYHVSNFPSATSSYNYPFKRENKVYNGTISIYEEEVDPIQRNANSQIGMPYDNSAPSAIHNKYYIKPVPGSLNSNNLITTEDLVHGKVNLSIPLTTFSYYDYDIPVSINNRYPQVMTNPMGDPTFYVNSRIGGDWSLSIDNYKVSRQVNGLADEHPTKGYFSPLSQSKVNNPASISTVDVQDGLEGEWDPKIDVFHFSTPSMSGSFIIDMVGGYEVLSENKFHVEYVINNNKLEKFIIFDNEGNEFVFGGDDSLTELHQSITSINIYRASQPSVGELAHVREIFETNNFGDLIHNDPYNQFYNLFAKYPQQVPPPQSTITTGQISAEINSTNTVNNHLLYLTKLPDDDPNREYYALVDFQPFYNTVAPIYTQLNDPDLGTDKVEVGWYLKTIHLYNGKSINFNYDNDRWEAYPTFNSSKTEVNLFRSGTNNDFIYRFTGTNTELLNLWGFPYFPSYVDVKQAVNEVHTSTVHFIKKPKLQSINDEDYFQSLVLDYANYADPDANSRIAPYVVSPSTYGNIAPIETLNNGYRSFLMKGIKHTFNNCFPIDNCSTTIDFDNYGDIAVGEDPNTGEPVNYNREDRSFLNSVTIDNQTKYTFEYETSNTASRTKKITYPTGGSKELASINSVSPPIVFQAWPFEGGPIPRVVRRDYPKVGMVKSVSESNTLEETYEYNGGIFNDGEYRDLKTYRAAQTVIARYNTTSPVFNSHFLLNGVGHQNVTKKINGIVHSKYTFSNEDPIENSVTLTDGSTQSETAFIARPDTFYDQMIGLNEEMKTYSNSDIDDDNILNEIITDRTFSQANTSSFPSIYLTNLEIGPWQNTPGSIRKGYSVFHYPFENQTMQMEITSREVVANEVFEKKTTNIFGRTFIPSVRLNNYRLIETSTLDSQGQSYTSKFRTPIEVAGLSSTNSAVVIQNPVLNELISHNKTPILETLNLRGNKIIGASSNAYRNLTFGSSIAIPDMVKSYESDIYELESSFESQEVSPSNPGNILFDSDLVDKIQFDKYDGNGRLLEYHTIEDDVHTAIIWGYKNQLPVAVITNATYNQIESYANQIIAVATSNNNEQIIQLAQDIRDAFPDAHVKSYTYQGLLLESETDQKGETTYYEYDDLGRLEKILDRDENILKEYRYHFANLIDDPITGYISTIHDLENKEVTFIVDNLTGGSGQYTYNWNMLQGGTQNGPDNTTSFVITYDCYSNIEMLEVELVVQDAIETENTITFNRTFSDLNCCPPLFSGSAIVTEIRSLNNFEGLELKIQSLQGGCGPFKYNWSYRVDGGDEYALISSFSSTTILNDSHPAFQDICQENVTFTCNISDLGIEEPLSATYPLATPSQYVDCSDNPQ